MPRRKTDVPMVTNKAARFLWRCALLEALAKVPALEGRSLTVLGALRRDFQADVTHLDDGFLDALLESDDEWPVGSARIWAGWAWQAAAARAKLGNEFPGFDFEAAREVAGRVARFLADLRLGPPTSHEGEWWLARAALATLVHRTGPTFALWAEDANEWHFALEDGPMPGREVVRTAEERSAEGPAHGSLGMIVDEFANGSCRVSTIDFVPVRPQLPAVAPGEDAAAYHKRAVAAAAAAATSLARAQAAAGIVKDPRPVDARPFAWLVLARCARLPADAIAAEAGVTREDVRQRIREAERRIGLPALRGGV